MNDEATVPTTEEEPGRVIGRYVVRRLTLRDPRDWDVSRAGRPIEPPELMVKEVEQTIVEAFEAKGYAVGIEVISAD